VGRRRWARAAVVAAAVVNFGVVLLVWSVAWEVANRRTVSTSDLAQEGQLLVAAVGVVLTSVLAWVTGAYVVLTRRILDAQRELTAATERQLLVARDAVVAGEAAAREAARARSDDRAPVVVAVLSAPSWPPWFDQHRDSAPLANELRLFDRDSIGRSVVAETGTEFRVDGPGCGFLWFRMAGYLRNDGKTPARVRPDGEARFIQVLPGEEESSTELPLPARVGHADANEFLLGPGDVAAFEWAGGHSVAEWIDAYTRADPPNSNGALFMTITVFDYFEQGTVDHIFIEASGRPLEPVPGTAAWRVAEDGALATICYPIRRTYRAEQAPPLPPPWESVYRPATGAEVG
jgi:hypothetical protein